MQSDFNVENITVMSLNQMCDLALGFVHPGVIHFDLLNQILRAIIQQCNLIDFKIKVHGDKSLEMQKLLPTSHRSSQVNIPSMKGSQYDQSHQSMPQFPVKDSGHFASSFIDQASSAKESHANFESEHSATHDKLEDWMSHGTKDTNVNMLDQTTNQSMEPTAPITVEQMQWIVNTIDDLQKQINDIRHFPTNKDIIGALRESGTSIGSGTTKATQKTTGSTAGSHEPLSRRLSETPIVDMVQIMSLTKRVDATEESITKLASLVEDIARENIVGSKGNMLAIGSLSELKGMSIANLGNRNALELLTKEVMALKQMIFGEGEALGTTDANLQTKVTAVEVRLKNVLDQVELLDRLYSEQINNLFGQCGGIEDSISRLERKLVDAVISQKTPILTLNEKYNDVWDQIQKIKSDQQRVFDSNATREIEISALVEQVEILKTTKVTKEEFEYALERKLDADQLMGKVSQEKFDKSYDELKFNIEDAIARLSSQEEVWQKALMELQNELVSKLEKKEMITLQEFVKAKLKILREKMNSLKMYRTEKEAAATKQMLLKNVKCLSCDADVGIKPKQGTEDYPRSPTLPPSKTIAPYLAYELDVMRKQQRGLAHSRNMHHFEASVRNKERVENRYCGGPHTITTPVQRVTRMGNFMEQWGPEISIANENFIKGTDQKIYVGCTGQTIKSNKKYSSMTVEGHILRDRKSIHEDSPHIPEKDMLQLEVGGGYEPITPTTDSRGESSNDNRKISSSKKNDMGAKSHRKKGSAISFADGQMGP